MQPSALQIQSCWLSKSKRNYSVIPEVWLHNRRIAVHPPPGTVQTQRECLEFTLVSVLGTSKGSRPRRSEHGVCEDWRAGGARCVGWGEGSAWHLVWRQQGASPARVRVGEAASGGMKGGSLLGRAPNMGEDWRAAAWHVGDADAPGGRFVPTSSSMRGPPLPHHVHKQSDGRICGPLPSSAAPRHIGRPMRRCGSRASAAAARSGTSPTASLRRCPRRSAGEIHRRTVEIEDCSSSSGLFWCMADGFFFFVPCVRDCRD